MELIWHGHSCFSVKSGDYTLVLDPYADDDVPGLPPLRLTANEVRCSHEHHDHNARQNVTLTPGQSPFTITEIPCWHDSEQGAQRGENIIHILEAEGLRIAHFGDLGHPLDPLRLRALGQLDAAMIPVGGYYTIGPEEAADLAAQLGSCTVIPMHYRDGQIGYPVLEKLSAFTMRFEQVRRAPGNSWQVQKTDRLQVLVLRRS